MAEVDEHTSFRDNPIEYCKGVYKRFEEHNRDQRGRIVTNREFYEGIDKDLEKRRNNSDVIRASMFVPETRPAIDSVTASLIDAVLEQNNPIKLTSSIGSDDTPEAINNIEDKLNEEMRNAGVLIKKYHEVIQGGALMPVVACKVGWEEKEDWIYERTPLVEQKLGQLLYMLKLRKNPPNEMTKRWDIAERAPYAEVLDYDEFLYDPTVDSISSSECIIHRKWMTIEDIESEAITSDYDEAAVQRVRAERYAMKEQSSEDGTIADEVADELEDRRAGYKDGKVLVCEYWIPFKDQAGRDETRIFVLAANKIKMSRGKYGRRSHWDKLRFPFIIFRFNKQFNRIEGTPPIEISMPVQRVYNDNINAFLDYLTYNVFPVLKRAPGTTIAKKPVFGPGKIWDVTNPEGLEPLLMPSGDIKNLIPFSEMMAAKIRQLHNASDIAQDLPGAPAEKATKTALRAKGASVRNRVPSKEAGDFLIEVAQAFIYMHQAMGDVEWLINVKVDAPALTGAKSPQEEREEAIYILEQAKSNPVYDTPTGLLKLRRLTEEVYLKFRKRNIDDILPTEEELGIIDPVGKEIEEIAEQVAESDISAGPEGDVVPMGGEQEEAENATI